MAVKRLLAVTVGLTVLAGCSVATDASGPVAVSTASAPCEETDPSSPSELPAVFDGLTTSWFGQNDLWVGLPDYEPVTQDGALVLRFPWVTLAEPSDNNEEGAPSDAGGPPAVVATNIDDAAVVTGEVDDYATAFGTGGLAFWPAAVSFPNEGCWTVTGTYGNTTVAFSVDVAAEQ